MVMQLYPPASTGNVVGPASAVNGNLAAFDGTTGELLEDSGIATSQVALTQSAVLEADFPKTNNTFANVTDLTLNLEAGRWYRITGVVRIFAEVVGARLDFQGGTAILVGQSDFIIGYQGGSFALADPSTLVINAGADAYFQINLQVQVDTGGTFIPRFRQHTTDATASTLLKYSTIQAIDVTPE